MKKLYLKVCLLFLSFNCAQAFPIESINEKRLPIALTRHLEQILTSENILSIRKALAQHILNRADIVTPYLEKRRQADKGQLVGSMTSFYNYHCVTYRIVELDGWGTDTNHLFDVALTCKLLQMPELTRKAGQMAIKHSATYLQLLGMAEDFYKVDLLSLSSQAARKAVRNRTAKDKDDDYQASGILVRIKQDNLAEEVYNYCLHQDMNWQYVLDIYKQLKKLGKLTSADQAFKRLTESLTQEARQNGQNFFTYVAQHCAQAGYTQDCELALYQAIEEERNLGLLWSCIEFAQFYKFSDLRSIGVNKLTKHLRKYPYSAVENFKRYYPGLIRMGEAKAASNIFNIAMKNFTDLPTFSKLIELIIFIKKSGYDELIDHTLQQAIKLCKPQDSLFDISSLFSSSWEFVPSSSCLLVTAKLSQSCGRPQLALQAADQSIACALAESYEKPEKFIDTLEGLKRSLKKLHYQTLVKKVSYYKAEAENPTFNTFPSSNPELFSIYWLGFENALGAEIKKKRPWIVISKPHSYGKGNMVHIIPLSTKIHGGILSVPIFFKGKEQEVRLDQARSVDTTRLIGFPNKLPSHYHTQLLLAYKNSGGR